VILTTSELLSGCFNHTTYPEIVLDLVSWECRIMQKANLAWKRCHLTWDSVGARVAISTFSKRPNLVQREPKKPNSNTRGQKRGQLFFPLLTAITKLYEPILSNLNKWQCSSITIVAQQQNKYMMKDCKRTT